MDTVQQRERKQRWQDAPIVHGPKQYSDIPEGYTVIHQPPPGFTLDPSPGSRRVQSADGVVHEFPAETHDEVIDNVMRRYAAQSSNSRPDAWAQFEEVSPEQDWSAFEEARPNWMDAPIVEPHQNPPLPPGFVLDEPTVPEGFVLDQPEAQERPPRTLSERVWDRIRRSKAETGLSLGGQIGEGITSIAGNVGSMAAAGLAGIGQYAREALSGHDVAPGDMRSTTWMNNPRENRQPDWEAPARRVEGIQQAGAELFAPESVGGQAVVEGVGKGIDMAGTAIKYPLSAVPFMLGGSEERQEFMEMPMSRYLGELAQDKGASPLLATLAHMSPDIALTAVGGGAANKAGKVQPRVKPPTIEELKAQSNALYEIVDNAGIRINDNAFRAAVARISRNVEQSGARRSLAPKTWKALDELAEDAKAGSITLKQVEELRRVLKKAQSGVDADKASATRALRQYDGFIENLGPGHLSGAAGKEAVEYLKSARSLWSRARKTEQIEDMIDTAGLNAGQYTGSGFENALRLEFRKLSRKKKQMKMFTPAEQKAIRAVAFGTATGNLMRQLGRFSLQSGLNAGVAGAAGFMVAGPSGAMLVPAVGSLARWGATRSTRRGAEKAAEMMARGAP